MNGWWITLGVVLDVVAAGLYVLAVREHRRIDETRRRLGLRTVGPQAPLFSGDPHPLDASRVDEATRRLRP